MDGPFEAMGRPIPRSDPAVETIMEVRDLPYWQARQIAREICRPLEANEPKDAFAACKRLLGDDVTLHYRVIATLLAHADMTAAQKRGGVGMEAVS